MNGFGGHQLIIDVFTVSKFFGFEFLELRIFPIFTTGSYILTWILRHSTHFIDLQCCLVLFDVCFFIGWLFANYFSSFFLLTIHRGYSHLSHYFLVYSRTLVVNSICLLKIVKLFQNTAKLTNMTSVPIFSEFLEKTESTRQES